MPRALMRYRLRTLLAVSTIAPPVLALVWYLGIIAALGLPALLRRHDGPLSLAASFLAIAIIVYSLVAAEPSPDKIAKPPAWQVALLWLCEWGALFAGLTFLLAIMSWSMLWGDNPPPDHERLVAGVAFVAAVIGSSHTSRRIAAGRASPSFIAVVWTLSSLALALAGPVLIVHWARLF